MFVYIRRKDDRGHSDDDRHALLRIGETSYLVAHHFPFRIYSSHETERATVLRVPLNGDGPQCTSSFQTFGREGGWRWTSISRGGFEKKSRFETAIPSAIGERSRFILGDSVALRDLEVPRGYLRARKFVKIQRERTKITAKTNAFSSISFSCKDIFFTWKFSKEIVEPIVVHLLS